MMGIPTTASSEDLRLMIGGKLEDMGREQQNVEVVIDERGSALVHIALRDDDGVFSEVDCDPVPTHADTDRSTPDSTRSQEHEQNDANQEVEDLTQALTQCRTELGLTKEALSHQQAKSNALECELEATKEEMTKLEEGIETARSKARNTWRLHCQQLTEWDTDMTEKDATIERLMMRVAELEHAARTQHKTTTHITTTTDGMLPSPHTVYPCRPKICTTY